MNIYHHNPIIYLFSFFLFASSPIIWSQDISNISIATQYIHNQSNSWDLNENDVRDLSVKDHYQTKSTGATHTYFIQRYNGIEIFNAITTVTVDTKGKSHCVGHRFVSDISNKISGMTPDIPSIEAVKLAAAHMGLNINKELRILKQMGHQLTFDKGNFSEEDIPVKLVYFNTKDGQLKLSWDVTIRPLSNSDFLNLRVDATTGEILDEINYTHQCTFHKNAYTNWDRSCNHQYTSLLEETAQNHINSTNTVTTGNYRVFKFPIESPAHGSRTLLSNPDDLMASPYGWHDTNGSNGAEYTYTRGNNVHAYQDTDGNNFDANDEPEGGAALNFDFPFNQNANASTYQDAAVTNLFYASNFMHDFAYRYGFDEPAGNFQFNNYGNGGFDNDYVRAEAQDGDGVNNAQFSTGPEGSKPRMEMFLWDHSAGGQRVVQVNSPEVVEGLYEAGLANFGPPISNTPVTGQVIEVDDGVYDILRTDGCEEDWVNGNALNGKIALIDRGGCDFEQKTVYAENYGAIAVIICDFLPEANFINGIPGIPDPGIPTVRMGSVDCLQIRVHAGNGLNITLVLPQDIGPDFLDGDFDNGIISHEYAHGISERLTGGPNTTTCLNNDEQMGEGWSDFFALAVTAQPGDSGDMRRGISTYLYREDNDGKGVRNYPYSTDMTINPYTLYRDIGNESIPHGVGAVWCSMLWDLYWEFSDEYGWSPDLFNGTAGNNMAIQLVMDGMKIQPCKPGFVDARDAIIEADEIRYGGVNRCRIWDVFARRGLGASADQGSNTGVDAIEAFDDYPLCVEQLKIEKSSIGLINAGGSYEIFIKVINHKPQTLTNVMVTDELPDGLSFTGNTTWPATQNGNLLVFDIGTMNYLDTIAFFFQVTTSPDNYSVRQFYYPAENESFFDPISKLPDNDPTFYWRIANNQVFSGNNAWYIPNTSTEVKQQLVMKNPITITGNKPTLRFYHKYKTQAGVDGGIVEITTEDTPDNAPYERLGNAMIRNGYPGFVQYTTFSTPNISAFSGTTNTFKDTYVDLSDYKSDDIFLRYYFASNNGGAPPGGGYWAVDDIEILDLFNYNGEACVTSAEGDQTCTTAPEAGTIVESMLVDINELENAGIYIDLYPNPANNMINLTISSRQPEQLYINLITVDGQILNERSLTTFTETQTIQMDVSNLATGMYFLRMTSDDKVTVKKVIVK